MVNSRMSLVTLTLLCCSVAALLSAPSFTEPSFPPRAQSLTILDVDGTSVTLSLDEIRALPAVREKECVLVGRHEGLLGKADYEGPAIADVLAKAPAAQALPQYIRNNSYVVFKGTDGFQATASWEELTESIDGRHAMIVLTKDGKPLPDAEGSMRTYFPGDKYLCRSVMYLDTIEIHVVPGVKERPEHADAKEQ